jgi:hypothetical protein
MNGAMAKKAIGGTLTFAGFYFLFRSDGTRDIAVGVALLVVGSVLLVWSARG